MLQGGVRSIFRQTAIRHLGMPAGNGKAKVVQAVKSSL